MLGEHRHNVAGCAVGHAHRLFAQLQMRLVLRPLGGRLQPAVHHVKGARLALNEHHLPPAPKCQVHFAHLRLVIPQHVRPHVHIRGVEPLARAHLPHNLIPPPLEQLPLGLAKHSSLHVGRHPRHPVPLRRRRRREIQGHPGIGGRLLRLLGQLQLHLAQLLLLPAHHIGSGAAGHPRRRLGLPQQRRLDRGELGGSRRPQHRQLLLHHLHPSLEPRERLEVLLPVSVEPLEHKGRCEGRGQVQRRQRRHRLAVALQLARRRIPVASCLGCQPGHLGQPRPKEGRVLAPVQPRRHVVFQDGEDRVGFHGALRHDGYFAENSP